MDSLNEIVTRIDDFVWGPVMLILLVGTGIFLTVRTRFLTWRNLGYALKSTLSKEARTKSRGQGDVSPFSALTTALAATIGTGNIVGVATAMVSGGPGALVWMWISAAFGLTSKFSECMLAIKYREVNAKGEMSGGPMYTMKKGLKNKTFGAILAWLFALFAVIASFGIGNMTQGNSIASALHSTFNVPTQISGVVITVLSLVIIVGGIKSISKVSAVVVPTMAIFYVICGLIVIIGNISNLPSGLAMIFKMAFSVKAVVGGKTGYTKKAKRTLITRAIKKQVDLIIVTFNCGNDFEFHQKKYEECFKNYEKLVLFDKGVRNIKGNWYLFENDLLMSKEKDESVSYLIHNEEMFIYRNQTYIKKIKLKRYRFRDFYLMILKDLVYE